jgi:hypothetical protein
VSKSVSLFPQTPETRRQNGASSALSPLILPRHSILRLAISRDHSKRDLFVPAAPGCVCAVNGVWQTRPRHYFGDSFAPAISFTSVAPNQCSRSSRAVLRFVIVHLPFQIREPYAVATFLSSLRLSSFQEPRLLFFFR